MPFKSKAPKGAHAKQPRKKRLKTVSRVSRGARIAIAIALIVLALATAALSWNQWLRFDDNADIQGTWRVDGTETTIAITDSAITLTQDVSYGYTLDTFGKVITFTFAKNQGEGSYAFSPERDEVIITERDSATGQTSTLRLVRPGSNADAQARKKAAEDYAAQLAQEQAEAAQEQGPDGSDGQTGASHPSDQAIMEGTTSLSSAVGE